jgi:multiple sugar transport system permease protein
MTQQTVSDPTSLSGSQAIAQEKTTPARVREARLGWFLVIPAVLIVVGMIGYPFVEAIRISFTDKMIGRGPGEFVGLQNYRFILQWPDFRLMVIRTVAFTIAAVITKTVVGLVLALAMNESFKGRTLLRGIFLLPWILPTYIVALVFRWLLDGQTGVVNQVLTTTGIVDNNIPFLAQKWTAIASLIFVLSWKGYPFYALTFLAGLQTIPPELYDAAKVDGAGRLGRFLYITLPGLRQIMGVVILLSTIWTMNSLEIPMLLTGGGPSNHTEVFPLLTYHLGLQSFRLGEGAAVPILMLPIIGLLVLLVARYLEKEAVE